MAADTTILNGDVGVWWFSNNRCKMLTWEGTTGTYTMNELYSAMQTLQDESDTIDDGTCFNADTPTEYTIGKIDSGDNEPWYITMDLMEHITGGSLKTSGWTRVQDSNTGIVCVQVDSGGTISASDAGYDIVHDDGDTGTLLEFIDTGGAVDYCIIRPDSSAIANSFDAASSDQLTCNGNTADVLETDGVATTGDQIWPNVYTIGTIDDNVHCYIYQGARNSDTPTDPATDESNRVYSVNSATLDYWGNGHIDVCVPMKDITASTWSVKDNGYLRVFARKGGDLYSSFEVANSTTSGGRNPVPLQTSVDLNQGTGTKTISFSGSISGTFEDGEIISQATTLGRGILDLANSDTSTDGYLSYFPIATAANGGALTAMDSGYVITGADSSATCTSNAAPANAGPALSTWFTNNAFPDIKFGDTNVQATTKGQDIDNDGNDEHWGLVVDCNSNTLAETYEWVKYITQYTQGDSDSIEQALTDDLSQANVYGEEYNGAEAYFVYGTLNGTINEGASVTQDNTGATGVILSIDTTSKVVLLRNVRGSFNGSDNVDNDLTPSSNYFSGLTEGGSFAASTSSPLGTFAGGTFFGARGVLLDNWLAADENAFILTDIEGTTRERPTSIVITVSNVHGNAVTETDADLVGVYLLDGEGGNIDKDLLTCDGGETEGGTSIATSDIPVWVPSSGRLLLTDVSENDEYIIGYSSWDSGTDTFTLDSATFSNLTTGTNANTLVSTSNELDGLDRGDFIWNETQNAGAYVTDVQAGSNTVHLDRDITSQSSTDTVKSNVVPLTLTSSDTVLPLIIHGYPTSDTIQSSLVYPGSTMYFRVNVRNSRETDLTNGPIKPYSSDGSTSGTDQTIQTVRTIDTIIT